jgi:ABC-type transport system involved in cytochrome bd biosynthesis fused ATPase/permease subunit
MKNVKTANIMLIVVVLLLVFSILMNMGALSSARTAFAGSKKGK